MTTRVVHRASSILLMVLSLVAFLVVLWGFTQPPLPDEGTGAHIFQLSVAAMLPSLLVFFATADWTHAWRSARPLVFAAAVTVAAFASLYHLERL